MKSDERLGEINPLSLFRFLKRQFLYLRGDLACIRYRISHAYITWRFRLMGFPVYTVKIREQSILIHLDRPIYEAMSGNNFFLKLRRMGYQLHSGVQGSIDNDFFWFEVKR